MDGPFADILAANRAYAAAFALGDLAAPAARELAVLTCIDSRIEPLSMLGLQPGDAKIIRNAGARVTDDAIRSLVLAAALLHVRRIMVVQHTDCAMTCATDDEVREKIGQTLPGVDVSKFEPKAMTDQRFELFADVQRLRTCSLLPDALSIAGFEYDVRSGRLTQLTD